MKARPVRCLLVLCLFIYPFLPGCATYAALQTDSSKGTSPAGVRGVAAAQASPESASPAPEAPDADPARAKRLMIYNADVTIVVPDARQAASDIRALAEQLGGFLQSLRREVIVIKVPAPQLNAAMAALEKLGEVTEKQVIGSDVTEEYTDLQMRLKSAETGIARLRALLAKAEKVEDMLKIEEQLQRLTEMVERIKGRLRYLDESIAYSTITVKLNAPVSRRDLAVQVPFPWVRDLATEFIGGTRPASIDERWFSSKIRFTMPGSFVKYVQHEQITRALSANGVLLKVTKQKNYEGGTLDFWGTLVRRTLVETRAIAVTDEQSFTTAGGTPGKLFVGEKSIGNKPHRYMAAIVPVERSVYVYEAWGPRDALNDVKDRITESMRSLRP